MRQTLIHGLLLHVTFSFLQPQGRVWSNRPQGGAPHLEPNTQVFSCFPGKSNAATVWVPHSNVLHHDFQAAQQSKHGTHPETYALKT